jgi:hypothetical protein
MTMKHKNRAAIPKNKGKTTIKDIKKPSKNTILPITHIEKHDQENTEEINAQKRSCSA